MRWALAGIGGALWCGFWYFVASLIYWKWRGYA